MKLNGTKLQGKNFEIIAIPRGDGADIIFKAEAIMSFDEFDEKCPPPKPPMKVLKGGQKEYDWEDSNYRNAFAVYNKRRTGWMILKSLEATEGLEWEMLKPDEPRSWVNWYEELQNSGFSAAEIDRIQVGIMNANCLNELKIEQARQNFLRGQVVAEKSTSGPSTELPST
jgi:hypothetical protein